MLPLLLGLALAQGAPVHPARATRDVATIPAPGQRTGGPDLSGLTDAQLARRLERLAAENRRAFSDRRALEMERLREEQDRRRHEREWDAAEAVRRAATEAETARQEAAFQAGDARRREAEAAEQRMVAAARARSARDAELAAEERAIEVRQARIRWLGLGALAAALAAGGWVVLRRRSR